ncbi:MAG: FHA domain-containing protein [Coriobacteriia bacterium]|nr:FHA domain-containing protein [Coriobacteriia bacterium]
MRECRVCGADISADASGCPACGTSQSDATESFEPVVAELHHDSAFGEAKQGPVLVVRKGPETGESFYLERETLNIGRDPESDIFLNDMTVSRRHARLEVSSGEVTVHDDGSLNGTYVNGVCVDVAQLSDGDVLQIGMFQMVYSAGRHRS